MERTPGNNVCTSSLEDAITLMAQWDIGPMRAWLERSLCGQDSSTLPSDFAEIESSAWWNSNQSVSAGAVARRLLEAASTQPDALPALLLYLRHASMTAWEESWHVDTILEMIADVSRWVDQYLAETPGVANSDIEVCDIKACASLFSFLADEIRTFATGIAGDLHEWSVAAGNSARIVQRLSDSITLPAASPCTRFVKECAQREIGYYSSVQAATDAAASLDTAAPVDPHVLDHALDVLATAPPGLDRADSSELRAHAASLRQLRAAIDKEWLFIDHGRLTFVFPFGLGGVPDREVVKRARENAMDWRLASLPVVSVNANLPTSDVWNSSDPLGRAYDGVALRLPEIDCLGPDGALRMSVHSSVWLSELGNHILRMDLPIESIGPFKLFELVRMASPEHNGLLSLGYSIQASDASLSTKQWDSLSDFVAECVCSLQECLQDNWFHPLQHFEPQAFLVLAILDQVSAHTPMLGTMRQVSDAADVFSLFGSQILSGTLWGDLASVAQWAQAPLAKESLTVTSMGSVHATMTSNSALLVGFGIPSYTIDLLADCFVFAASIDGLFGVWYGDLARLNMQSQEHLEQIATRMDSKTNPLTSAEVREVESDLTHAQVQIHDFVLRCRSTMLFIESPTLVQLDTFREVLDQLLSTIGFGARVNAFIESANAMTQGTLDPVLDRLRNRISEQEAKIRKAQDQRARLAVNAMLAGVAVAGLSGLASLLQSGYQLNGLDTGFLASVVVLLAILIGAVVWRANQRMDS